MYFVGERTEAQKQEAAQGLDLSPSIHGHLAALGQGWKQLSCRRSYCWHERQQPAWPCSASSSFTPSFIHMHVFCVWRWHDKSPCQLGRCQLPPLGPQDGTSPWSGVATAQLSKFPAGKKLDSHLCLGPFLSVHRRWAYINGFSIKSHLGCKFPNTFHFRTVRGFVNIYARHCNAALAGWFPSCPWETSSFISHNPSALCFQLWQHADCFLTNWEATRWLWCSRYKEFSPKSLSILLEVLETLKTWLHQIRNESLLTNFFT